MDDVHIGTGLAILGSKDLLNKLLGPSADYLGGELKGFIEQQHKSIEAVLDSAVRKIGDSIKRPGTVAPRILHHVIDEGRFCEDPIVIEYLGGILASSRSEGGDDRGVIYLEEIKSLSSQQLRIHYLIYSAISRYCPPPGDMRNWYNSRGGDITLVFSEESLVAAVDFPDPNKQAADLGRAFTGLSARGLINGGRRAYDQDPNTDYDINVPYRFCHLLPFGYELFLWGVGRGDIYAQTYFEVKPEELPDIPYNLKVLHVDLGEHFYGGTDLYDPEWTEF